jgi:hypothetical protein
VLVSPDSATCHYYRKDKSLTIPINKDHSNMIKFSRGDSSLGPVLISIKELCSLEKLTTGFPPPEDDIAWDSRSIAPSLETDATLVENTLLMEQEAMLRDLGLLLKGIEGMIKNIGRRSEGRLSNDHQECTKNWTHRS